jgi:3-hydroxybutyryl-CoA dehydrogenase
MSRRGGPGGRRAPDRRRATGRSGRCRPGHRSHCRKPRAKQKLYRDLEAIVGADCIFGTNTSSISVTAIGAALQHPRAPGRPAFLQPGTADGAGRDRSGLATDKAVADTLFATAPPGARRRCMPSRPPASSSIASPAPTTPRPCAWRRKAPPTYATIDACCREAGGFRMGPFELMDMIGHDVNFAVTNRCGAPSTTTSASCPR